MQFQILLLSETDSDALAAYYSVIITGNLLSLASCCDLSRASSFAGEEEAEPDVGPLPDVTEAVPLQTGSHTPELSEPSTLLDERQCNALAQAVPIRHRWRRWILAYSTNRDGISLQTLYR